MTSNDISLFDLDLRSRSHIKVKGHRRGGVCVLWMLLVFYTSTKLCRGYIFTSVRLCVCVSVCPEFLWTKFQPNGCTDLDAVFAKWLLPALARTLLNLVALGQRSRSQWRNINFFFMILYKLPYFVSQLSYVRLKQKNRCVGYIYQWWICDWIS